MLSTVQSVDQRMRLECAWNAVSVFANYGRAVTHAPQQTALFDHLISEKA
jgi:hypothetical protein